MNDKRSKSKRTPERIGTATVRATKLERRAKNALPKAAPVKQFEKRVVIEIIVYRERAGDPDNCCAKSEIDGIVSFGFLRDDSSKYVEAVTFRERPVRENDDPNNYGKEGTKIIITECE